MAKNKSDDSQIAAAGTRHGSPSQLVRLEVLALASDRPLLREVARTLREEPGQARELRNSLEGLLGLRPTLSRKAVLAAAPLEGIDLTRSQDRGREIDL